jgi:hypothetical protein
LYNKNGSCYNARATTTPSKVPSASIPRSLFGHVSIVIPPLFFYLSRIGNSFPKRVLIRKKAISDPRITDPALACWLAERPGQTRVFVTLVTDVTRPAKNASAVDIPS